MPAKASAGVAGKRVVVTGVVAGESRQTAEAKLRDAGATVQSTVTAQTDLLIIGARVGAAKIGKATIHGVTIVKWEDVWSARASSDVAKQEVRPAAARQVAPMLAKAGELPVGPGWLYEVKWDGYRCVATVKDGKVAMQSRSGKSEYADQFRPIAVQLSNLPDCVIDGEIVVLDENGDSQFESLGKGEPHFVVFDVLETTGNDLRGLTLLDRRKLLGVLSESFPAGVSVSPTFEDGEQLLAWAADRRLEGIVAKRTNSTYREGTRSDAWVKIKLRCEQEFVVLGWKPGEGAMAGAAGSIALGVTDGTGRWTFCGRAGSGGDYAFWQQFTTLPHHHPGAVDGVDGAEARDIVWVEPTTVVQVRFQRWTEDGRLWHPSVLGIRSDKSPTECRREPVPIAA